MTASATHMENWKTLPPKLPSQGISVWQTSQPTHFFSAELLVGMKTPGVEGVAGSLYLMLLCYHQNDSTLNMGNPSNYMSHFNVSLIVEGKATGQS